MKNKKIIALLLALALTLIVVGCATQPTPQPLAPPEVQDEPEYEYNPEYEYEEIGFENWDDNREFGVEFEGERYNEQEFSDENVQMTIFFDRPQYTHSDIVGLFATITNIGDEIVVFTKGSGSNRVPDALNVELGQLTALFHPIIMTMDMRTEILEPGESITFALPFAPYMYADTEAAFGPMVGFDADIEFFQTDEWVRVQAGEIAGSVSFSYILSSGEDFFMISEEDEISVLEMDFTVTLTE